MRDRDSRTASTGRRLIAALLTLLTIDAFVPRWLGYAERQRYEAGPVFRFQYSDLFGIGPLVQYLREHPRGDRPRAVFLGDSVVWGYRLRPEDSLPEQFARRRPDVRVFNFAVNGFGSGSAFLVLKTMVRSVDTVYLEIGGAAVNPGLARLIPVSDADVERFGLERPDRVEQRLEEFAGFWRLYRDSYRLQAALFATSTRNYLYANKSAVLWWRGAPARDMTGSAGIAPNRPSDSRLVVAHPVAETEPTVERAREVARAEPWLWEYASFIRASGKRAVFYAIVRQHEADDRRDWADLNRIFRSSVVFVRVGVPDDLRIDPTHLSAVGSNKVAALLDALTAAELESPRAVH